MIINIVLYIIYIFLIGLWLYCLYYAIKKDRKFKSILLLVLLNIFYIPIYFDQIKKQKQYDKNSQSL
jgi:hypothetical protein